MSSAIITLGSSISIDTVILIIAGIVFVSATAVTAYNKYKQMKNDES